eukprot:4912996-Prymnesium_polylepis.4
MATRIPALQGHLTNRVAARRREGCQMALCGEATCAPRPAARGAEDKAGIRRDGVDGIHENALRLLLVGLGLRGAKGIEIRHERSRVPMLGQLRRGDLEPERKVDRKGEVVKVDAERAEVLPREAVVPSLSAAAVGRLLSRRRHGAAAEGGHHLAIGRGRVLERQPLE